MVDSERVFPLAPMSPLFWALTAPLLALAPLFLLLAAKIYAFVIPGLLLSALYLGVWLFMRPSSFALTDAALEVRFPLRRWIIPRHEVAGVRVLERTTLRSELGAAVRVGVGGLWGTFGLLWTSKR